MKRTYTIIALLSLFGLLVGCGGDNSLQPDSLPGSQQPMSNLTLSIYTGSNVSRAVDLPGDPGVSPDMPGSIKNIHLFMYVEPANGSASYLDHFYIEVPDNIDYYVFQKIAVPECRASFYAIVNAGPHDEWEALTRVDEVLALTTQATPSRDLFAGQLLNLAINQDQHSGLIEAGLVAAKVDVLYNIGTAITNYNAKPGAEKPNGDCVSAKVVSLRLKNVPSAGYFFNVRSNTPDPDHTLNLAGDAGPGQAAWINGRYDCYLYDSGSLDLELVVKSIYTDGYEKETTYNVHVDTPQDLAVAPYYLLRFNVVGFSQTAYNYRWTTSI